MMIITAKASAANIHLPNRPNAPGCCWMIICCGGALDGVGDLDQTSGGVMYLRQAARRASEGATPQDVVQLYDTVGRGQKTRTRQTQEDRERRRYGDSIVSRGRE